MIFRKNKPNKYGNKKVEVDGLLFDSKKEMQRYLVLKDAERNGVISDLKTQVRYELIPPVKEKYIKHLKTKDKECERTIQLAITYTCDFQYIKDGVLVIEDVKASPKMLPKEFVLKEKMMFALKNLKIKKVFSAKEEV